MYSNSVATWQSGISTPAGTKKGWGGNIWTAINTTTSEPAANNANWSLDTPLKLQGVSLFSIQDPKDYLKIKVEGITFMEVHVSRPAEVLLEGITFLRSYNRINLIESIIE